MSNTNIKLEGKKPLGRPRHRWEDNIRMDLKDETLTLTRNINLKYFKFILREYYSMEQKPVQQQKERIAKLKPWICNVIEQFYTKQGRT